MCAAVAERPSDTFLPEPEILSALRRQWSWSDFKQLIYIDDELKRTFYAEMPEELVRIVSRAGRYARQKYGLQGARPD